LVPYAAGVGAGALEPPAGVAVPAPVPAESPLFQARVRGIWRFLLRQKASFWLINFYMFLEYVRPQTVYPALDILPWSMLVIALCAVAWLSEGQRRRKWTVADTGMILYTGIVLASCVTAYDPGYALSFTNISIYLTWLLVYFMIAGIVNTEEKFFVFMLAFLLYNLKMSQHVVRVFAGSGFAFSQWAAVGAPGWFHNPGELGIQMVMYLPISFQFYLGLKQHWGRYKRWFFLFLPFSAAIAVAASSSRGAQLALAVAGLWLLFKSRYKVRGVIYALMTAGVVYLALPAEQRERFSNMGEDKSSLNRLTLWEHGRQIMNDYPVLGVGYKNWIPYYRANYVAGGQLPHNIFIEAGAELGYPGVAGLVFLIGATLVVNGQTRRMVARGRGKRHHLYLMTHGLDAALWGYLVAGFFVTVLYYPFLWINLAMTVALYATARNTVRAGPAVARA
jgi:O-antigen ligase